MAWTFLAVQRTPVCISSEVFSGLKVSLLARIVHRAIGRLAPRAAPLIAVGAMVAYGLLAGASAAALRAAAMGVLVVIAGRLRRDSHVFVSLALSGAIMLGLKPDLAHDVSFQLSFAGTAGIASMTDGIAKRLRWIPAILRDPFSATIAAEAATWPLMLANFHQLSVVAPVANALVLPLLPAIMVLGGGGALLAGGLAAGAWPITQSLSGIVSWPLMQASGAIASWFRLVVETAGSVPYAAVVTPYFPSRWLAAAAILNGGALAGVKLRQFFWQRKVWAAMAVAGLIAVALLLVRPDGRVHVYALDVGTGSAVLIRTPNGHQILVDAGPDADRFAQAIGRALPPTARTIDLWLIGYVLLDYEDQYKIDSAAIYFARQGRLLRWSLAELMGGAVTQNRLGALRAEFRELLRRPGAKTRSGLAKPSSTSPA